MYKKLLSSALAAVMALSLAACGSSSASSAAASSEAASSEAASSEAASSSEAAAETPAAEAAPADDYTLTVAGLKGPTTMGLVNLLSAAEAGESEGSYEFTMYGAADEIVPLLVKGELDAAAVPANLAATLYQKTQGAVEVLNINTLGVLYIVEIGDEVQSVEDLAGRTIVTTGKGTTPEYVLRYVLSENGLDPDKDVTIEFCSEATEASARLAELAGSGENAAAMLPQPFVTSVLGTVENSRVALDMNEEWEKVAGSTLVTGVMIARKEVVEQHPAAIETFLSEYEASVEKANSDPEGTGALCETYGVVAKAALAQKALPQCNIVFVTGSEMKADLETYFTVLYDADPASVGGTMPADDFYYGA